jgi:hypothetical protein
MRLFECIAILMPPLVPEATDKNRRQFRPIRYPDDQFLLHRSILFGSPCAVLLHPVGQHARPVYSDPLAAIRMATAIGVRSNVVWAQRGDHRGGPLVDFGFPLEVLWESVTPRLYQRLLRLGLMPRAHGHEGSIHPRWNSGVISVTGSVIVGSRGGLLRSPAGATGTSLEVLLA